MSYRELWVLVNRLPQESWTQTVLRDQQPASALRSPQPDEGERKFGPWAFEHYQFADLLDAVNQLARISAAAGGAKDLGEFVPTPRPGAKRPGAKPKKVAPNQAVLAQILNAREQPQSSDGKEPQ